MTRIDRLVLNELVGPFIGSALLFTALFFAGGELVRYAQLLQSGESILVVGQVMFYTLPTVLAFTFPMAMLLATLLGFGRLSSDSEIVALTAAGCSFERVVAPVAVMGLAVSLMGMWFNNTVVPAASRARNIILSTADQKAGKVSGERLPPIVLRDNDLTTVVIVEGSADFSKGELTKVNISFLKAGKLASVITAPRATWIYGSKNWKLYDYEGYTFDEKGGVQVTRGNGFDAEEIRPMDTPDRLKVFAKMRNEDIDTRDLVQYSELLRKAGDLGGAREREAEAARRNSIPFAAFAFGLIGAALGVRPRREGRGVGFGLSVIVTFLYYVGLNVTTIIARNGGLPANLALMLPNIICIAIAIFFIRRVMRG